MFFLFIVFDFIILILYFFWHNNLFFSFIYYVFFLLHFIICIDPDGSIYLLFNIYIFSFLFNVN